MDSKLSLDKTATVALNYDAVLADLEAIEPLISIFPKLESLNKLGPNTFEWKLKPIGAVPFWRSACSFRHSLRLCPGIPQ